MHAHRTLYKSNSIAITLGLLSALAYAYLASQSQYYGDATLSQLLIVAGTCASISFGLWFVYERQGLQIEVWLLLGFAVLFRLIGLNSFPILEDDFYRYLWDARMTVELGSPYAIAPAEFFASESLEERFETILDGINYPDVKTVYGPTIQWVFALAYLISPGEVWPLQLLMGIADIIVILVLLQLAKPNSVLLYAWSPLVIKEFVISAHPDVLGVAFVVIALLVIQRKQMLLAGGLLALACGVKVFAILLVPFLLRFCWRAWLAFGLTAVLIALPFGLKQAWLPDGLSAMGSSWLFNAPLYFLADALLGSWVSISTVKISLLGALAIGSGLYLLNYLRHNKSPAHLSLRGDLLYAGLFICAPALNAWYLVWLLPFAVFRPSVWAWATSVFIFLSYASGINLDNSGLEPYEHSAWILAIEFMPLLMLFLCAPYLQQLFPSLADAANVKKPHALDKH